MTKINGPTISPVYHPAVKDAAATISDVYHERDQLCADNVELLRRAEVAEGVAAHLKEELRGVTEDRNFHMRKSYSLETTLLNGRNLFENALALAHHEAQNPGPAKEIAGPKETADERVLREAEALKNTND